MVAGAVLATGPAISAVTNNHVIAFVLAVGAGMILMISGLDFVLGLFRGWAPQIVIDLIASFSFITHFGTIAAGVLELRAIVFFLSLILLFLAINGQVVELKKAG